MLETVVQSEEVDSNSNQWSKGQGFPVSARVSKTEVSDHNISSNP